MEDENCKDFRKREKEIGAFYTISRRPQNINGSFWEIHCSIQFIQPMRKKKTWEENTEYKNISQEFE